MINLLSVIAKIKADSRKRAEAYFVMHKHEIKTHHDEPVKLVFESLVQILESAVEPTNSYQIYYEIRSGENLGITHFQMMFHYSETGEPLDDFCIPLT